jgi:hypothetical protein
MNPSILMPIMIFMTRLYHSPLDNHRSDSVSISLKTFSLALMAGIMLFASSCEEDPTGLGRKLLPGSDFVNIRSTDTLTVKSLTFYSDSIQAGNTSTSYLGELFDPYFGKTTAEFVTQIRLGSTWAAATDTMYAVDSVKLYLRLLNVTGSGTAGNILTLSETDEKIYTTSTYYSSRPVPLTGFSVTNIYLPELDPDTINNIVLDIPVEFGSHLFRADTMLYYNSSVPVKQDFTDFFKGLYFQLFCPEDPVMMSLSLSPPSSYSSYSNYFVVYGRDEVDEPITFFFILDAVNKNANYNRYIHQFSEADPDKEITHYNDGYYDTLSYLQNMNGLFTRIDLPGLKAIKDNPAMDDIAINKARLKLPYVLDGDLFSNTSIPSQIYARYLTSTGHKFLIPDYLEVSSSFYDGGPDTLAGVYDINLATLIQRYLDDKADTILPKIEIFLTPLSSSNLILKANDSHFQPKFELTYTKF